MVPTQISISSIEEIIPQLQNEKIDIVAATSVLHLKAAEIRNEKIKWQSYLESSMISKEDYQVITFLDSADDKQKAVFLQENSAQCAKTFYHLLGHISKDQTLQYVLVMINDLLQEDKQRVDMFNDLAKGNDESTYTLFLNLLNREDGFIANMSARIITKIACGSPSGLDRSDMIFFLTWLKDQLCVQCDELKTNLDLMHAEKPTTFTERYTPLHSSVDEQPPQTVQTNSEISNNEFIQSVTRCLQMMLRSDVYRFAFLEIDGVSVLMNILSVKTNFQVQYQTIYCVWVLTFNEEIASSINKHKVIPILSDILSESGKEKVNRIILAVFRNLIEKIQDPQIAREHCMALIQSKITKQLSLLEQKKYDDEDIVEDIRYLSNQLQITMRDLSSFEEYSAEVKSGRLEWSPVHKSNFWRENAQRLSENNNELLKVLINLLQSSTSPVVLCVACYDIGEYVRHHPAGKHIIEQLGGKQLVMQLLGHDDLNVRYEALLAVQKIMVHHWESLGKPLDRDTKTNGNKLGINTSSIANRT